jgi:hypothetical protein
MSRNEIFQSIISQLEKEKLELEEALANSKAAAKEAPGAMQSHSDTTRAQEQTRSAELAHFIEEKAHTIHHFAYAAQNKEAPSETVELFSLVEAEVEGDKKLYLISGSGGGIKVSWQGRSIFVVAPESPIGAGLLGRKKGAAVTIQTPAFRKEFKIVDIF